MELRHLRRFIAVAEELHFSRAAARLHIEQSPLSRTIRQLESDLGVRLFERNSHGTRLTWPGQVFLDEARRVLGAVEQARAAACAAATGYRGQLRIALSDGISQLYLSALLAKCREDSPEVEIRLCEVSFASLLRGLRNGAYDAGLAKAESPGDDLVIHPVWREPLAIAVPARHPLLAYRELPLAEVLRYPLVLCDPDACEGCSRQVNNVLRAIDHEPDVAERVTTHELMMTLVAAGYGLGLTTEGQLMACRHPEVVSRPLAGDPLLLTTYLLRRNVEPSAELAEFIARIGVVAT